MTRFAERDEYQVGTLINGLPTCTFRPKTYHRTITNIVLGNSVTSTVSCYRGLLGSTPVAQNQVGQVNTLRGAIQIPAGQTFFVQWSTAGADVRSAFARVSWERDDNPLEGSGDSFQFGQEWDATSNSIILPPNAGPNDGAIILDPDPQGCLGSIYDAVIVWRAEDPSFRGQFFIGVVNVTFLPSGTTTYIDHGFMLDDPDTGTCWIYVTGRWSSDFDPVLGNTFGLTLGNVLFQSGPAPNVFNFELDNTRMQLNGDDVSGSTKTLRMAAPGITSTSASFANVTGASVSIIKRRVNTAIQVHLYMTAYANPGPAGVEFGVLVNGVDNAVCKLELTNTLTGQHTQFAGTAKVASGIAAGSYTVQIRWRRISGAGTATMDGNDQISMEVREVDAA